MYLFTLLGMAVGGIIGSLIGIPFPFLLIPIFVGGCLWGFIVNFFRLVGASIKAMMKDFSIATFLGCIIGIIIGLFKAIYIAIVGTIKKLFYYTKHLIKTSGFIRSDSRALREMDDYMEYTLVRSQNVGVDLATLMNEDSQLFNNSYARNVMENGEEKAEATIRGYVTSINENGEIIRSFAA